MDLLLCILHIAQHVLVVMVTRALLLQVRYCDLDVCVIQMMRGIKEDLQLALKSQQESSESCSGLSSAQRIERVWEVQESESECLERTPMWFDWQEA